MIDWIAQYSGHIVLIGFFTAFCGIGIWIFRPGKKAEFAHYAEIPLKEVE